MPALNSRRFRFSMLALLLGFSLICVTAGTVSAFLQPAWRQKQTVEWLQSHGFSVMHDYHHIPKGGQSSVAGSKTPKWIVDLLGVDAIANVVTVYSTGGDCNAAVMARIAELPDFEMLQLSGENLTDAALKKIKSFENLYCMILNRSSLTGAGLEHIARSGPGKLANLSLVSADIHDDDLQFVAPMASLRELDLSGTHVSDKGLAHLGKLPLLEELKLNDTSVTGSGLAHLIPTKLKYLEFSNGGQSLHLEDISRLPYLRDLTLCDVALDASDCEQISQCSQLERLYVRSASVGDAELLLLSGTKRLRSLNVRESAVSYSGVSAFHRARHDTGLEECYLFW